MHHYHAAGQEHPEAQGSGCGVLLVAIAIGVLTGSRSPGQNWPFERFVEGAERSLSPGSPAQAIPPFVLASPPRLSLAAVFLDVLT
jgi:hypothetical protein